MWLSIPFLSTGCGDAGVSRSPGSLRIYLARHGQTDWNAERRLQGQTDTELNETGREQAQDLAARLTGIELDAIYSSELQRSRVTAEIVAGDRLVVESLAGLNELHVGKFEGADFGRDPGVLEEFRRRAADPDDELDGGESRNQHLARVRATVADIRSRHAGGQILIVGHGGTNELILQVLLDLSPEDLADVHQANDELYLIEVAAGVAPRVWKYIPPTKLEEL